MLLRKLEVCELNNNKKFGQFGLQFFIIVKDLDQ